MNTYIHTYIHTYIDILAHMDAFMLVHIHAYTLTFLIFSSAISL